MADTLADEKKKKLRKRILTVVFVVINIAVIAIIAILEFGNNDQQKAKFWEIDFKVPFLLLAIICFLLALLFEAMKYTAMLKSYGYTRRAGRNGLVTAVLGKYFDNITPAGAGGQPFQIMYLKKQGCSDGVSAMLPIFGFLGLQFSFVFIGLLVFIFGNKYLTDLVGIRITAIVGLCFYAFVPVLIVLFSIFPTAIAKAIRGVIGLLAKIKIIKNPTKTYHRAIKALSSYTDKLSQLQGKKVLIAKIAIYSLLFQFVILSMPYFVLHAFGSTIPFMECFCRVTYIYAAITIIFTPGNSGAAEASFFLVFNSLNASYVFWAMLVWRLLCYYSWLASGVIYYIWNSFNNKRLEKRKEKFKGEEGGVALFLDSYFPHVDGVVKAVDAYAKRIKGSFVVCPKEDGADKFSHPYELCEISKIKFPGMGYGITFPFFSIKIRKYMKEHNYRVIHVHSPFPLGRMALKFGRKYDVPVCATFHSKYYDDFYNVFHSHLLSKLVVKYYIVPFYRKCDYVYACSKSTAQTLKDYGYEGEVNVINNGTDYTYPEKAEVVKANAIKKYDIPGHKPLLFFVGQLIWHKNIKLILDTLKELKNRNFAYTMIFAGDGYNEKEIVEYARQNDLYDVRFVGSINDRELLTGLYLRADLFFFPSVYDNAPLVLCEASMLDTPSLLAKGSNAAENIVDGENGYIEDTDYIKMADKIMKIFNDKNKDKVSKKAKETLAPTWESIITKVASEYDSMEVRKEPIFKQNI